MKIIAIVQARISSTRLPGKVLADIEGKSMLQHVLERLKRASLLDEVVVAIAQGKSNFPLLNFCLKMKYNHYYGSENDVLRRYYQTAFYHNADVIVRITADCPCIDPHVVNMTIQYYLENSFDYVTFGDIRNPDVPDYPDGFDVEVFSFGTLENAYNHSLEREHVGKYMLQNCSYDFVPFVSELSRKVSVDTEEDLKLVKEVFAKLGNELTIWDVVDFLNRRE